MTSNQTEKLETIVSSYTFSQQREIFTEECAEAIQAVQKLKRAVEDPNVGYYKASEDLISEVADVLIMAEQMRLYLGADKVDKEINMKLDRQIGRIREVNYG